MRELAHFFFYFTSIVYSRDPGLYLINKMHFGDSCGYEVDVIAEKYIIRVI